jgi:hypothetical protein
LYVARVTRLRAFVVCVSCAALAVFAATARADLKVDWMRGAPSPGTPARYDEVGVIKVGSPAARNVLVLEPGTSAGAAYFVPLAQWIASRAPEGGLRGSLGRLRADPLNWRAMQVL